MKRPEQELERVPRLWCPRLQRLVSTKGWASLCMMPTQKETHFWGLRPREARWHNPRVNRCLPVVDSGQEKAVGKVILSSQPHVLLWVEVVHIVCLSQDDVRGKNSHPRVPWSCVQWAPTPSSLHVSLPGFSSCFCAGSLGCTPSVSKQAFAAVSDFEGTWWAKTHPWPTLVSLTFFALP